MQNLYIIDMTHADSTNGVDRHIACLINGLKHYPHIKVYWISLVTDPTLFLHKREQQEHCLKITIPMPEQKKNIIGEFFWTEKYNSVVYPIIAPYFEGKKNRLIHTHTLNLIDMANYIKKQLHGEIKIITHIHCIPWKDLYNHNRSRFEQLYRDYYLSGQITDAQQYGTSPSERRAYENADRIISGTYCAQRFLQRVMSIPPEKVTVAPNGMADHLDEKITTKEINANTVVECLYVGRINQSKGVFYILEALRIVQKQGYKVRLNIAGQGLPENVTRVKVQYADVETNLLGLLPFEMLSQQYKRCHIGIIASVEEQASYVGVEMSMHGMPIVATAVDGLDEMFTDRVDGLKVPVILSRLRGLEVDVKVMSQCIIEIITNSKLRQQLSQAARRHYLEKLTAQRMVAQEVEAYRVTLQSTNRNLTEVQYV